jgi:hypothetical protein
MDEVFPVLAGVVVGLAIHHVTTAWLRVLFLAVLSLGFGTAASWLSGELAISWAYILIDTGQVFVAASLTAVLAAAWRRRAWRRLRP